MCLFVNTPMYPTGTSTGTDSVSKTYTQIFSISIQLPGGDIGVRNIFLTLITLIQFNSIQFNNMFGIVLLVSLNYIIHTPINYL